jgi:hypothetical protein
MMFHFFLRPDSRSIWLAGLEPAHSDLRERAKVTFFSPQFEKPL